MLSIHIIVDSAAHHGAVGFFWKRVEPFFSQHLFPCEITFTQPEAPMKELVVHIVERGYRKVLLIGNQQSIWAGVNGLMSFPESIRKTLEVGLWPLNYWELLWYSFRGVIRHLDEVTQVFKAGKTCPIDLGHVSLTLPTHEKLNAYFCSHSDVSFLENASLERRSHRLQFFFSSRAHLQIDEDDSTERGGINARLLLRSIYPHSIHFSPEELKRVHYFALMLHKEVSWGRSLNLSWLPFRIRQKFYELIGVKQCSTMHIQAETNPLVIRLDGQPHKCIDAQFSIVPKALPVIVPVIPLRLKTPATAWLVGARSKSIIANRDVMQEKQKSEAG